MTNTGPGAPCPLTKADIAKQFGVSQRIVEGWFKGERRDSSGRCLGRLARPLEHMRAGRGVFVLPEWVTDFMRANSSLAGGKDGAP